MFKSAAQDIGENLGVLVRMLPKPFATFDKVIVDDTQISKSHMLRVMVIPKTEAVGRFEPAKVGLPTFFGVADS